MLLGTNFFFKEVYSILNLHDFDKKDTSLIKLYVLLVPVLSAKIKDFQQFSTVTVSTFLAVSLFRLTYYSDVILLAAISAPLTDKKKKQHII